MLYGGVVVEFMESDFWSKVKRGAADECWEFQGPRHDRDRYGMFSVKNRIRRAHRVAYELGRGPIPESLCVLHECDNPPCCNPAHLFLGTKKRNMEDAKSKKRHAYGSRHGRAVLNEDQVHTMRKQYAVGVYMESLARELNLHSITVMRAITGQTWKHVKMYERFENAPKRWKPYTPRELNSVFREFSNKAEAHGAAKSF